MSLDARLLAILVCPKCRGKVEENGKGDGLVCHSCRLVYPIRGGIPVMLCDEAKPLERGS